MKESTKQYLADERGSASAKFFVLLAFIVLLAHAGYNYVPVAYNGASFRQEMDTAVVKGLAASGRMKPAEVIVAHMKKAASDYKVPSDALIEIKPGEGYIAAHASYQLPVNILPFGMYKYNYQFDYTATPTGYLLKE